jgi:hypothetical protein
MSVVWSNPDGQRSMFTQLLIQISLGAGHKGSAEGTSGTRKTYMLTETPHGGDHVFRKRCVALAHRHPPADHSSPRFVHAPLRTRYATWRRCRLVHNQLDRARHISRRYAKNFQPAPDETLKSIGRWRVKHSGAAAIRYSNTEDSDDRLWPYQRQPLPAADCDE